MKSFLYSPLSFSNAAEKNHPALLILFILKELVKNSRGPVQGEPLLGPFDWTVPGSSHQKLQEYFSLLPVAFPDLASKVPSLNHSNKKIFTLLEPFIMACASNENILLFLIRHQKELAVKPLLDRICPEGLDAIREKIAAGFRKRGYYFTRWTHAPRKA